ncbi:MAG: hypothetical protein H7196_03030 [candidate division SR1 bacterium]|nr:hypothetical protein [candidate division SR1 bacterium]
MFLKNIISEPSLYSIIYEAIRPYLQPDYQYYSNGFLLNKIKNQYSSLLQNVELAVTPNQLVFSASEVVIIVEKIMSNYLDFQFKWNIKIGKKYRIIHKKCLIYIADREIKRDKLISILFHEIVVHVYRSKNYFSLTSLPKFNNYLVFEEGLAKILETVNEKKIENQPRFSFLPILLLLSELGLSNSQISKIFNIISPGILIKNKYYTLIQKEYKKKYKCLSYLIGNQKVQYFSNSFEQSNLDNSILFHAFSKVCCIIMEYPINPLDLEHIKILIELNILSLKNKEFNEYKKFVENPITKKIEALSEGISEHEFLLNYESLSDRLVK